MTKISLKLFVFISLIVLNIPVRAEEIGISESKFVLVDSKIFKVIGRDRDGHGERVRLTHFEPNLNPDFELSLTFIAVEQSNLLGPDQLRVAAQEGCQAGAGTGESIPTAERIPSVEVGFQCTFSDPKLLSNSMVPPGQFRYRTLGTIEASGYVVLVIAYSNTTDGTVYDEFLRILHNATLIQTKDVSNKINSPQSIR